MKETCCYKNLDKAVRKGRASYACPVCGGDVSLAYFCYCEAVSSSAKALGKKGGLVKSEKKANASRLNGKKGGAKKHKKFSPDLIVK